MYRPRFLGQIRPTIPNRPVARQAGLSKSLRSLGTSTISNAPRTFSRLGQPRTRQPPRPEQRFDGNAGGFRGQDTVERSGGFDVVMEKIVQWEQETPASNGAGMIDDFRLWGSRRRRRGGVRLTNVGSDTQAGHDFNCHNASLSEGVFPRHCGRGLLRNAALDAGQHGFSASVAEKRSEADTSRVPSSPAPAAWRRGGEMVEGATLGFSALVRHRGGVNGPP